MNKTERALSYLGLAMKAGAVAKGTEAVRALCRSGRARLALLPEDCSAATAKRITTCCAHYKVPLLHIPCTKSHLGRAVGCVEAASAAVSDGGLARQIAKLLTDEKLDRC